MQHNPDLLQTSMSTAGIFSSTETGSRSGEGSHGDTASTGQDFRNNSSTHDGMDLSYSTNNGTLNGNQQIAETKMDPQQRQGNQQPSATGHQLNPPMLQPGNNYPLAPTSGTGMSTAQPSTIVVPVPQPGYHPESQRINHSLGASATSTGPRGPPHPVSGSSFRPVMSSYLGHSSHVPLTFSKPTRVGLTYPGQGMSYSFGFQSPRMSYSSNDYFHQIVNCVTEIIQFKDLAESQLHESSSAVSHLREEIAHVKSENQRLKLELSSFKKKVAQQDDDMMILKNGYDQMVAEKLQAYVREPGVVRCTLTKPNTMSPLSADSLLSQYRRRSSPSEGN